MGELLMSSLRPPKQMAENYESPDDYDPYDYEDEMGDC